MPESIDATNIPRWALFRGKMVRILNYQPKATRPFEILENDDSRRWVARSQLTFTRKGTKK